MILMVSGRWGNHVYNTRNGRVCSRRHVKPANPRTRAQQRGRGRFAALVGRWKEMAPSDRETWNRRAKYLDMSGYNLFISRGMRQDEAVSRCRGRIKWYRSNKRSTTARMKAKLLVPAIQLTYCTQYSRVSGP